MGERGRRGEGVRSVAARRARWGGTSRCEGGMRTTRMGCEDGGRSYSPFYRAGEAGRQLTG
jgi:hypothetical protein